jgi:hypothetical protein
MMLMVSSNCYVVIPAGTDSVLKVLTKFAVYGGIGAFASHLIPVAFELLGWGVLPAS